MVIKLTLDLVLRGLAVLTGLVGWSAGWTASAPSTLAPSALVPFALTPSALTFLAFFWGVGIVPGQSDAQCPVWLHLKHSSCLRELAGWSLLGHRLAKCPSSPQ